MIVSGAGIRECPNIGTLVARIVEVLVHERMSLGELGRVQDWQFPAAQHGDDEQHGDQELFHDPVHPSSRPASAPFVKSGIEATKFHRRHLGVKLWTPSLVTCRATHHVGCVFDLT